MMNHNFPQYGRDVDGISTEIRRRAIFLMSINFPLNSMIFCDKMALFKRMLFLVDDARMMPCINWTLYKKKFKYFMQTMR